MGRTRWLLVIAFAGVLACQQGLTTRERMLQEQNVTSRLTTWARLMNNAAQDSLFTMYDHGPDLLVIWPDGKLTKGWEETRDAWQAFYRQTDYMNFVTQSPTVHVLSPSFATTTFRHSTDIVRHGERQPVRAGYATLLWVRTGGDAPWTIRLSHISFDPPSAN